MIEIDKENYEEEGYIKDAEGNLIPNYDMTIKLFDDGDIVSGCVVRIDRDEVLIDIGYKSEGVIPLSELSIRKNVNPHEIICVGDEIDALVMQKEDKDGRLILSKKRAEFEKAWDRIEAISREKKPVEGTVIEVVKGGLILDIGLRGFLPASLIDVRRVKDLLQYVGQKLECMVIEIDRNRNNVVLSRRAILDEERRNDRERILSTTKRGQIVKGKVSSIVDFGAFVDLGGMDGLVHISELSWTHVDHPSDVLSVNQEIEVKVLDIDQERERISLGYKQTQENPWKKNLGDLKVGDKVTGKVIKVVNFGVFLELDNGIEALLHNSEIQKKPNLKPRVGDELEAKIGRIDESRRRLSLSLDVEEEASAESETETETAVAEETKKSAAPETTTETEEATTTEEKAVSEEVKAAEVEVPAEETKAEKESAPKTAKAKKSKAEKIEIKLAKKKADPELAANMPPPEPGSLEDVLNQMKQAQADE